MAFHKVLHTVPDLGNRKSGKELVEKFEAAVVALHTGLFPVESDSIAAEKLVDRLRKELIEVCDYSIDME